MKNNLERSEKLHPLAFVYWLQGFIELNGKAPTQEQWNSIVEHLKLVFDKVTSEVTTKVAAEPEISKVDRAETAKKVDSNFDYDKWFKEIKKSMQKTPWKDWDSWRTQPYTLPIDWPEPLEVIC